jgi:hypothetical protein
VHRKKAFFPASKRLAQPPRPPPSSPRPPPPVLTTTHTAAPLQMHVPRFSLPTPKVILHLFSGRRRGGDLQHWLEQLLPGMVWVISLDVTLSRTHGDLTDHATVSKWLSLLWTGQVVAVIAGPPCETWSVARHSNLDQSPRLPRPLRSLAHPWGMPALRPRELQQVAHGNALLQTALLFYATCLRTKVSMILEHPSCPDWRDVASIWKLPEVVRLKEHSSSTMVDLHQCAAGAPARKPTTLLCAHLPELLTDVRRLPGRGFCNHVGGHPAAVGRTADRAFRTTALKEYPTRLCRTMAIAIATHWLPHLPAQSTDAELPLDWAQFYQPLDPFADYEPGPDFAGQARS